MSTFARKMLKLVTQDEQLNSWLSVPWSTEMPFRNSAVEKKEEEEEEEEEKEKEISGD